MSIGIVKTRYGSVRGVECDGRFAGITYFKAIPFAKPPVGGLRWKPPQDPECWEGVRICDRFAPAPPQDFAGIVSEREIYDIHFRGFPETSEDCLYLNVCTPAQSAGEKRPVFIWFHGGGLKIGYANDIIFSPEELARKGAVVVQVAQRVGTFGYLSLPQLSAEQNGRSGNYGLMDQFKALDWIIDNIEQFGGDPGNITLAGQSGGSHKNFGLVASPYCKGRVKRIINETGLRWAQPFPTLKVAERRGREYLRYQKIDPDISLEELRKLPTEVIYNEKTDVAVIPGEMICDGDYIPFTTFREGFDRYLDGIDIINMTNLGEADVFGDSEAGFADIPVSDFLTHINSASDFYAHFANLLGPLFEKYNFPEMIHVTDENAYTVARALASYGLVGRHNHSYPGWGANFGKNLMLDRIFGMYMKSRYRSSKVYTALWSHYLPTGDEIKGKSGDCQVNMAWHASELWYTLGSMREGIPPTRPWTENDWKISDMITSYYMNFMKTGDPNGTGLPHWPESGDNFGYIEATEDDFVGHQGIEEPLHALCYEFVCAEYRELVAMWKR